MLKVLSAFFFVIFFAATATAQTREELEHQRAQLRKEIDETQKLINSNKSQTKAGLSALSLKRNKVNLQERIIVNINKDLRLLDDNIYVIQKDVNKYNRLLDTLKREYANSMVYEYKNRGNYEFLNFIFSADNFNDAVKRMSYLKSYRKFREMQGQNILRTQELRRDRLADLGVSKKEKNKTLGVRNTELSGLEKEKEEQAKIVASLQKNGKELNNSLAAKKKQAAKINNAIASAIAEAKRIALAEAEAKRKAELKTNTTAKTTGSNASTTKAAAPATRKVVKPGNELLNSDEMVALNASFEKNRGMLPWPVDKGAVTMHFGPNKLPGGGIIEVVSTTIASDIGSPVKAVFDGEIRLIKDDIIVIQHGRYFTTYSNLSGISVRDGQSVTRGQVLGKVSADDDGIGSIDFQASDDRGVNYDPEKWLRNR